MQISKQHLLPAARKALCSSWNVFLLGKISKPVKSRYKLLLHPYSKQSCWHFLAQKWHKMPAYCHWHSRHRCKKHNRHL